MVYVARELRQRQTKAENILWEAIRNHHLANLKFRRQHPIAHTAFVADFLCYEHGLVIELDGEIHQTQRIEDRQRQQAIEDAGYHTIRFTNEQVLNHLQTVLTAILAACDAAPPLPEGEGDGG